MPTDHDLFTEIRQALRQGHREQAEALALSRQTKDLQDPALHLAWAEILEELGLIDELVKELHLAVRDDPGNRALYPRLAEIYADQGRLDRAAHCWAALAKKFPDDPLPYQRWGEILVDLGEHDKAREVWGQGQAATGSDIFAALLRDLDTRESAPRELADQEREDRLVPSQSHLVSFTSLFSGREGVYARQWVSPSGESGYTPVQEPFTLKVAENHILGNYTVGLYPVRLDNTVNFIAFDFDLAKFVVRQAISSQRAWEAAMHKVHQCAIRLLDAAASHELPLYLEDSGFKGRHAWIFLETPIPAGVAKKCGDLLVRLLQPLPPEVMVEVFPKQGAVKKGGLGNLIKIPLGIHKRTGKRALFLEPDGQPVAEQLQHLETLRKAPRRLIYGLIQRLQGQPAAEVAPAPPPEAPDTGPPPWEEKPAVPLSAPAPPYHLDTDPQFQYLLSRCPVLKAIVDRINQTSLVSKEETLVLIHTLGHLEQGPAAVNELFQRCLNADLALFLKSQLRGNPMSCPKIRARIPEITRNLDCNCTFDLAVNLYPTPVIHLHGLRPGGAAPTGQTIDSLQFQGAIQEYLTLRKQLRETQLLLERYEKRLAQFFQEAGVDSVQTPLGVVRCRANPDGSVGFVLEI